MSHEAVIWTVKRINNMLNIGITGGIGVGKTTVCRIFETLDIPVYFADDRAKRLMTGNRKVKSAIIKLFGKEAYFRNGRLNRKFIGSQIFGNQELLTAMNQIVHPAVFADAAQWVQSQNAPYALQEAALLVESGRYKSLDKLIVVSAPEEVKIKRVQKRDRKSQKDIKAIIRKQLPDKVKLEKADFVIINDGQQALIPQVLKIHNKIMAMTQ